MNLASVRKLKLELCPREQSNQTKRRYSSAKNCVPYYETYFNLPLVVYGLQLLFYAWLCLFLLMLQDVIRNPNFNLNLNVNFSFKVITLKRINHVLISQLTISS